nr:RNA-directed DNA polymerase, eukaryota, reverse transcriptase zinc-binding domain protein [Tanacetum cinerariifolium]
MSIWVRWNNVLASKKKGGLGVSSLFALNRAFLFKWVWRFFTQKETLWARVISAIHGVDGGFGSAKTSGQAYIWCSITKEMERLASQDIDLFNFMQKKIRNGLNTFFWNDSWRGDTKLKDDFPRLYVLEQDKSITVVAKMEGVLLNSVDNRWCWNLTGSGDFNVASARKFIDDKRLPIVSTTTRWIKEVPIKVNILAWKVRLDCLPTRWNISRREVESSTHLFFDCRIFKENF